jgi:NAD(P)-dependent dehydrogenase (short-subunit alcohol dehydrogenase family)
MRRFTNKIVVITGGTSGIGFAAAKQFIKEGAKVVLTGRSPQSAGDAQKEIGGPDTANSTRQRSIAEVEKWKGSLRAWKRSRQTCRRRRRPANLPLALREAGSLR